MKRTVCLLLSIWFLIQFTKSEELDYYNMSFRGLSIENGLTQNTVISIFQDRAGFIWMGTHDGLNRYDGRRIINYQPANNSPKTIAGSTVYGIAEDDDGLIYIGTYGGGLSVLNPRLSVFTHYQKDTTKGSNWIPSDLILKLVKHPDGNILMGTRDGLSVFNPKTKEFRNYVLKDSTATDVRKLSVLDIHIDSEKSVWVATNGGGLFRMTDDKMRFERFQNRSVPAEMYLNNIITSISAYSNNTLLVSTYGGVYQYNKITHAFSRFMEIDYPVQTVFVDSRKNVWLGSEDKELAVVVDNRILHKIIADPFENKSIPEHFVQAFYEDRQGGLWFGLKTRGVVVADLYRKPFTHLYHHNKVNSIAGNEVYGLAEDPDGYVWISSLNGLTRWDRRNNTFKNFTTKNSGIPSDRIMNILSGGPDSLWIGFQAHGLCLFNPSSGRFKRYVYKDGDSTSLPSNEVFAIEKDHLGRIWVGTYRGVARLDKDLKRFHSYPLEQISGNDYAYDAVFALKSDSKGRLWVGTENGLSQFLVEKNAFKTYVYDSTNVRSISNNSIIAVTEDREKNIWITTSLGLSRYDEKNDDFERINFGWFNQVFTYVALRHKNDLWVSTNRGLVKINPWKKTTRLYDVTDGIQSNEFNPAGIVTRDGYFMFAGINGVTGFYPDSLNVESSHVPPLYFTDLKINGDVVDRSERSIKLGHEIRKSIEYASRITLFPNERIISVDFTTLEYFSPEKIKYFYRMLPNSTEWIPLENQNYVTFINLNPGKYTLEIRSTNADQVEVNNLRSLEIIVLPFWYQMLWFKFVIALIAAFLILLAVRWRFIRLRKDKIRLERIVLERTKKVEIQKRELEIQRNIARHQRDTIAEQRDELEHFNQKLEQKVKERTHELEIAKLKAEDADKLKSAFLSNMSHEIRTPMNAIIGFSELLLDQSFDESEKKSFAELIRSNGDHLLNLLNDIIDVSMIEAGQMKFSKSKVILSDLVQEVYLNFKNNRTLKLQKREVDFELHAMPHVVTLNTDSVRVKQVLYNLISNAIKFTERGSIEIGFIKADKFVEVYVRDTGIGIEPENQKRIFERFRKVEKDKKNLYGGNGLGLTISRNLIEQLGGTMRVESVYKSGSTFYFTLPLNGEIS